MSHELLYTSSPQGLKPGSRGFCTVLATKGLPAPLAQAVEGLSGYRPIYAQSDERARRNPVVYSHLKLQAIGRTWHVLSRIADFGLDYSQRPNKLAHHVILDSRAEQLPGGPANLLASAGFMRETWDGEPTLVPPKPITREPRVHTGICEHWKEVTGDAGWAGVVAESFLRDPDRLVILLFEPGQEVLPLFAEVLSLLPVEKRWDATFTTYFTALVNGTTCNWRAIVRGSKEAHESLKYVDALRIDLMEDLTRVDSQGEYVLLARSGVPNGVQGLRGNITKVVIAPSEPADSIPSLPPISSGYSNKPPTIRTMDPPPVSSMVRKNRLPKTRKNRTKTFAAVFGLFAASGAIGFFWWNSRRTTSAIPKAEQQLVQHSEVKPMPPASSDVDLVEDSKNQSFLEKYTESIEIKQAESQSSPSENLQDVAIDQDSAGIEAKIDEFQLQASGNTGTQDAFNYPGSPKADDVLALVEIPWDGKMPKIEVQIFQPSWTSFEFSRPMDDRLNQAESLVFRKLRSICAGLENEIASVAVQNQNHNLSYRFRVKNGVDPNQLAWLALKINHSGDPVQLKPICLMSGIPIKSIPEKGRFKDNSVRISLPTLPKPTAEQPIAFILSHLVLRNELFSEKLIPDSTSGAASAKWTCNFDSTIQRMSEMFDPRVELKDCGVSLHALLNADTSGHIVWDAKVQGGDRIRETIIQALEKQIVDFYSKVHTLAMKLPSTEPFGSSRKKILERLFKPKQNRSILTLSRIDECREEIADCRRWLDDLSKPEVLQGGIDPLADNLKKDAADLGTVANRLDKNILAFRKLTAAQENTFISGMKLSYVVVDSKKNDEKMIIDIINFDEATVDESSK